MFEMDILIRPVPTIAVARRFTRAWLSRGRPAAASLL